MVRWDGPGAPPPPAAAPDPRGPLHGPYDFVERHLRIALEQLHFAHETAGRVPDHDDAAAIQAAVTDFSVQIEAAADSIAALRRRRLLKLAE